MKIKHEKFFKIKNIFYITAHGKRLITFESVCLRPKMFLGGGGASLYVKHTIFLFSFFFKHTIFLHEKPKLSLRTKTKYNLTPSRCVFPVPF